MYTIEVENSNIIPQVDNTHEVHTLPTQFAYKCTFEISDKHAPELRRVRVPLPDSCVGLKNEPIRCYKCKI